MQRAPERGREERVAHGRQHATEDAPHAPARQRNRSAQRHGLGVELGEFEGQGRE
jgi:hypothetical protein